METTKVNICDFRADLSNYISANQPVTVIRRGKIVGHFIPSHGNLEAHLVTFKQSRTRIKNFPLAKRVVLEKIIGGLEKTKQYVGAMLEKMDKTS